MEKMEFLMAQDKSIILSPCMGYCRAKEYDSHLRAL